MYMDDYKRWLAADLEDPALKQELEAIAGQEEEIKDRFLIFLRSKCTAFGVCRFVNDQQPLFGAACII